MTESAERIGRMIEKAKVRVRNKVREWLGIVQLDRFLSGRIRELEKWKAHCIVAVPVDKHFASKDIIILAGRFGLEDKVEILSVEFKSMAEFVDLARRLETSFRPQAKFFWDGFPGFTKFMKDAVER